MTTKIETLSVNAEAVDRAGVTLRGVYHAYGPKGRAKIAAAADALDELRWGITALRRAIEVGADQPAGARQIILNARQAADNRRVLALQALLEASMVNVGQGHDPQSRQLAVIDAYATVRGLDL